MNYPVNIPAAGSVQTVMTGTFQFLRIVSATVPFQISFDGSSWKDAKQNSYYRQTASRAYFRSVSGVASAVTFACDNVEIDAEDTAQSVVPTSARGCGGSGIALTVNKAIAQGGTNTNYVYNAGNAVDLTVANSVTFVPGMVNGLQRKTIYFNNKNSGTDICIFDSNGGLWLYLKAGADSPIFETSSDFYLGGMGGNAVNFIYCETFYAKSNN